MKVRCIKFFDHQRKEKTDSSWLSLGKVYYVMEVWYDIGGYCDYSILTTLKDPGFASIRGFPAESFEIVSEVIPSNWAIKLRNGRISLAPKSWQEEGFYEKFYDADPSVYHIFERERDIIFQEDP